MNKTPHSFSNILLKTGVLAIFLIMTACNYFETKKVDSEDLYQDEILTISWDDIDQYPLFTACDESVEKPAQRLCFKQQLSQVIMSHLSTKKIQANTPIVDTISMGLAISNTGEIKITRLRLDSIAQVQLPDLARWLQEGIDKVPRVAPALKRGIPVNTAMTLPIILRSKAD